MNFLKIIPLLTLLITGNVLANNPHIEDCGDKSLRECKDGTALVLIDMQNFFLKRTGGYKDPPNAKKFEIALKEQQRALEVAMANNMPIVVVEYLWEGADPTIKPLADKLKNYKNKTTIKKTMDGVFDSSANEMNKFLESKGVDNLVMIGANGGACVQRSISGALHHEYDVAVISNTVIDFNFDDFQYPYTYNEKYHFGETLEKCKKCSIKQYPDIASYQAATSLNPWAAVVNTSNSGVESNRKTLEETSPSSGGSIFNAIESFFGGSGSQQ